MRISDWSSDVCSSDLIRAPSSGRISRKLVTEGNLVNENSTLLTTIVQLDPIYFYFDIDERSYLSYQRLAMKSGGSSSLDGKSLDIAVQLTDEDDFLHKGKLDFTDNRRSEEHTSELQSLMRI